MSRDDIKKFSAGAMDKGVSARSMDFQGEVNLSIDGYNLSQGLQQGLGPRPGMATLPGHADNETISGTRLPGLRAAEGTPAAGFTARRKVLGVYALKLPSPSDVTVKVTTYAFLVSTIVSSVEYFDIVLTSTTNGSYESLSAAFYNGFGITSYSTGTSLNYFAEAFVPDAAAGDRAVPLRAFLRYPATTNYVSSIVMSVTGPNVPTQWVMGQATATGGSTTAPSVAMHKVTSILQPSAASTVLAAGVPSEYNLQNFTTTPRALKVFALTAIGGVNIQYSVTITTPTTSIYKQDIFGAGTVTLDLSAVTATKDTAGVTYANTKAALVNDPVSVTNASYKAILVAGFKPWACLFQDAYRGENSGNNGKTNQWYDLTQNSFQPRSFATKYSEEAVTTKTCFAFWPNFVRGTAMVTDPDVGLGLTAANTGVLRSQTVYEFTFSLYNKRLDFETNVGKPVKVQTGTDDFVSLALCAFAATPPPTLYSEYWNGRENAMFPIFANFSDISTGEFGYQNFMNQLQYRFYYRQEGTFEWLPALFIDVAQYWFYPFKALPICTGAIQALPGGQPGGFNDYSPLAKDNYTCVAQYKDRAFWFSDKQVNFSLRNNIFAYPARNSISAVAGEFKGGIVHNYPGQAQQSSRLIIFGTKEIYVARFTGALQQANVQVSADNSGVFDIDGSDLEIDPWTSVTSFSYRSAVVAEGILYWWGPQGIFRDDGVQTPTRISGDLEPNLFSLYDVTATDQIVGNYNNQTKEIEWIYTPADAAATDTTDYISGVNKSIIYNTISGNFTPGSYSQQIDWMQQVNIDSPAGTGGYRNIVGTRLTAAATTQRAYFFDQKNRAGDFAPTRDWVISAISTPTVGVRRLTLAAGYDATSFGRISVGDLIALQQTRKYASSLTAASDMVAEVAAITSTSLDITLPDGASLDGTATLTFDQYFPFWQATPTGTGQNGFAYSMITNYWMPAGTNGYFFWLYAYLLLKVRLWAGTAGREIDLGYRTPTALATLTDSLTMSDNSDGNFQVYHPLRPGDDNQEGQGIKFIMSGVHIGHEWVLQYMEAHARSIEFDGDPLKRFEG